MFPTPACVCVCVNLPFWVDITSQCHPGQSIKMVWSPEGPTWLAGVRPAVQLLLPSVQSFAASSNTSRRSYDLCTRPRKENDKDEEGFHGQRFPVCLSPLVPVIYCWFQNLFSPPFPIPLFLRSLGCWRDTRTP